MEMTYTETLVVTHCWCGIALAIPANLHRTARDNGDTVYCPVGHGFSYGNSFRQQLVREREQRLAAKDQFARERERHLATKDLLKHEERSHSATRGHLTRTKQRIGHGVCPCCRRTFQNIARHMQTKHPDYEKS